MSRRNGLLIAFLVERRVARALADATFQTYGRLLLMSGALAVNIVLGLVFGHPANAVLAALLGTLWLHGALIVIRRNKRQRTRRTRR